MASRKPISAPPARTLAAISRASAIAAPHTWLAALLLIIAGCLAYANTFAVPLILDDTVTIGANPSIRSLWPLAPVLSPPSAMPTAGRPVLNLSFALNYAVGGTGVGGYHVVNLAIHLLAGLALFGVVRRTLLTPPLLPRFGADADWLALAVAGVWLLHPLQTSAVTYLSQRAESLMGLFYFTTLYSFIRGATASRPAVWYAVSVAACVLGMATKEVMVTAPVMVLLYDRLLLSPSFRAALRQRPAPYLGLGLSWLVLAASVLTSHLPARGVGYGGTYSAWTYALTETRVVVQYLGLAFWPRPLVFDYGAELPVPDAGTALPFLLILGALAAATLRAWFRWPALALLGCWIFLILAPTSSVVPIHLQPMAESRMYLPLAAVVALGVVGLHRLLRRRGLWLWALVAVGCGLLTAARNQDYRTELSIWGDTVAKRPDSSRANNFHGMALSTQPDRLPEAIVQYEQALRLRPDFPEAHNNLANALLKLPNRWADALVHYEEALRLKPDFAEVHSNLANLQAELPGRLPEAIIHYERALQLTPDSAVVHNNLGSALARTSGRIGDALPHFEAAVRLDPAYAQAHHNLGNALLAVSRRAEAIAQFETALLLRPDYAQAHTSLANALATTPDALDAAFVHFETALRLRPDFVEAHYYFGVALLQSPTRQGEARGHFETVLRLRPGFEPAVTMLARTEQRQDALGK